MLNSEVKSQNDTLIYIGDPMCSWCYGFGPELDKVKAAFPDVPFEMVMGGLRPGGKETLGDLKEFLWQHWKEVQQKTGQKFNFNILNQSKIYYDTEPACRAVIIMRKMKPASSYDYFKDLQKSFYVENNHPLDEEVFAAIAEKYGVDHEAFLKAFEKKQAKMDSYSDFSIGESMGVSGFPALIAKIDGKLFLAASGYRKAETIIGLLKQKGMK